MPSNHTLQAAVPSQTPSSKQNVKFDFWKQAGWFYKKYSKRNKSAPQYIILSLDKSLYSYFSRYDSFFSRNRKTPNCNGSSFHVYIECLLSTALHFQPSRFTQIIHFLSIPLKCIFFPLPFLYSWVIVLLIIAYHNCYSVNLQHYLVNKNVIEDREDTQFQ